MNHLLPRIAAIRDSIATSLWFIPALSIAAAILFAWAAVHVEAGAKEDVWWLNQGGVEESGRLLSALLTALITMATLVISITMVVLTLAAGQLGPRLIRSFVADRRTQVVLGIFVGTVLYILLIFRLLDGDLAKEAVPHFAVTMASLLMVVCLLTLIFYVHLLARSIVADTMISRVGADLDRAIKRDRPEPTEQPSRDKSRHDEESARYCFDQSGYVQTVDYRGLVEAAVERHAVIELSIRPGHHLIEGRTHVRIWPASALDDERQEAIAAAIVIGSERTPVQDVEFFVRQLVEVALRALSPGINDPFTAIAVIDRLAASLAIAMQHGDARTSWCDEEGTVRLIAAASTFGGLVDLSFNQIRQSATARPDVLIRLIEALAALAECPGNAEQEKVLRRHMDAVMETGRQSIGHPGDLAALEERYDEACAKASQV